MLAETLRLLLKRKPRLRADMGKFGLIVEQGKSFLAFVRATVTRERVVKVHQLIRMLFSSEAKGKASLSQRFLLYVAGAVLIFFVWAAVSDFDQVISGEAKIVPFDKLQTVQHFEGGIIKEIHIRAGQKVSAGMPLLSLNPCLLYTSPSPRDCS